MSIADQFCSAQLFENREELLHGGECFVEGEMGDAVNVALFELLQGGTVLWRHDGGEALPLGIGAVHDVIGTLAGIDERGNPAQGDAPPTSLLKIQPLMGTGCEIPND